MLSGYHDSFSFRNPNHTPRCLRIVKSDVQIESVFLTVMKMFGDKRILRADSETVSNSYKARVQARRKVSRMRIDNALIR